MAFLRDIDVFKGIMKNVTLKCDGSNCTQLFTFTVRKRDNSLENDYSTNKS